MEVIRSNFWVETTSTYLRVLLWERCYRLSLPAPVKRAADPSSYPRNNHTAKSRGRRFTSAWLSTVVSPCCLPARSAHSSMISAQPLWCTSVSLDLASPRCVPLRATQNTLWNPIRAARAELDWDLAFVEIRIQIAFPTHCKRRLNMICKKITFHVCICCQDFPKPIWVTLPQLSVTPMSHGGRAYDDNISCPLPPLLVLEWNLIGQLSDSAAPAAKLQHRETAVWPVGTESTFETTAQNLLSQWQC